MAEDRLRLGETFFLQVVCDLLSKSVSIPHHERTAYCYERLRGFPQCVALAGVDSAGIGSAGPDWVGVAFEPSHPAVSRKRYVQELEVNG